MLCWCVDERHHGTVDLQHGFCFKVQEGSGQRDHQRLEESGPAALSNRSQEQPSGGPGRGDAARVAGGDSDLEQNSPVTIHVFEWALIALPL